MVTVEGGSDPGAAGEGRRATELVSWPVATTLLADFKQSVGVQNHPVG